jgi:hypothetical protein
MKLCEVIFEPKAGVKITLDEIGILECLSDHHYDATCRMAAKQGGFIYGMKNREGVAAGSVHILSEREVQTLCKLTEMGAGLVDQTALASLRGELLGVLSELHEQSRSEVYRG